MRCEISPHFLPFYEFCGILDHSMSGMVYVISCVIWSAMLPSTAQKQNFKHQTLNGWMLSSPFFFFAAICVPGSIEYPLHLSIHYSRRGQQQCQCHSVTPSERSQQWQPLYACAPSPASATLLIVLHFVLHWLWLNGSSISDQN